MGNKSFLAMTQYFGKSKKDKGKKVYLRFNFHNQLQYLSHTYIQIQIFNFQRCAKLCFLR
jgi:hypothetical protein